MSTFRNRLMQAEQARWDAAAPREEAQHQARLRLIRGDTAATLNISIAPHIGELRLNLSKDTNSIALEEFEDGEELVRLKHSNLPNNIFKIDGLQAWFDAGKRTNPSTREVINQEDIEKFTYVKDLTKGGRRQKSKKSRKNRKNRKTNRNAK